MRNLIQKSSFFWSIFAVCTALSAILQGIAVLTVYDPLENYFRSNAFLPVIAVICALLGALAGTIAARRTEIKKLADSPFLTKKLPAPAAVGFLAVTIAIPLTAHRSIQTMLVALLTVCSAISVVYTIAVELPKLRQKADVTVFLGFFAMIASILIVAYYYFDASIEMNAPLKIMLQMGLLCIPLYFTAELRYLIGEARPRSFLMLSVWLISMSSLSAISLPIAFFTGKLTRTDYLVGAILVLCMALTALMRIRALYHTNTCANTQPDSDSCNEDENGKELP